MTHQILKRPQARRDIEECFVHIAENDLDIGVHFLAAVEDSLDQLAAFPFLGKVREFQNKRLDQIRSWHVKGFEAYLILYTVTEETIDVIRVLHGARNIDQIFE